MKYEVKKTSRFRKDVKRMMKRGVTIEKLTEVVLMLAKGEVLPEQLKDHPLHGDYEGFRDCHIEPDWVLIYAISEGQLILTCARTGTHSKVN